MKTTILFQRVRPPQKVEEGWLSELFNAFGGGYKNGGLSSRAMAALSNIFEFDYMGAAEYEYGAVPNAMKALSEMSLTKDGLVLNSLSIPLADIKVNPLWSKERKPLEAEMGTLHFICGRTHAFEVLRRLKAMVTDEDGLKFRNGSWPDPNIKMKDQTSLGLYLKYGPRSQDDACGGLELDNGFFVTANEDMAKKFFSLFQATQ